MTMGIGRARALLKRTRNSFFPGALILLYHRVRRTGFGSAAIIREPSKFRAAPGSAPKILRDLRELIARIGANQSVSDCADL